MNEKTGIEALRLDSQGSVSKVPAPGARVFSRVLLPGAIILVSLALLLYSAKDALWSKVGVTVEHVVTKSVTHTVGTVTVQAPGWVEADPYDIYVPALAGGIVKDVLVLEGENVKAGQVVAKLIDDDARYLLDDAKAQLMQRQGELEIARANLIAAQSNWDNPVELDLAVAVTNGKLDEDKAKLDKSMSFVTMHRAKLKELEDNYNRIKALLPDAASQRDVKQAGFRIDSQKAQLASVQKELVIIEARLKQSRAAYTAAKDNKKLRIIHRKSLDTAKAELIKKQGQLNSAKVVSNQARLRLERMDVKSPVDGCVLRRLAVPGGKVMLESDNKLSANIVHLYDPKKLQVRVDIPLSDAAKVGIGQQTEVYVDVLPQKAFKGRVTRIVHEADIQKNTLEVKVAIDDPSSHIKPEMLARVKFIAKAKQQSDKEEVGKGIFVPEKALQEKEDSSAIIWLVAKGDTAIKKSVTIGQGKEDGWIEIISGLNISDIVITSSTSELLEGQKVSIIKENDKEGYINYDD